MCENDIFMGQMPKQWREDAKSITFCVTEDCNLACKYCYMVGKNNKHKMSLDTAKKAVDFILNNRQDFSEAAVIWDFIGGEPFLEIELIDQITDYIKQQMYLLNHPWFEAYRLGFSTNGILYDDQRVQKYFYKNRAHVSVGMSVDGNKIKHDLQRVKPDGSGSYDDVTRNVPLWLEQFPGSATKATFAHDDLPYLKDSVISLWELGIKMVSANVVFENVWHEGDDLIFESQLRELADYIIENKLFYDYSVRFFDPSTGNPVSRDKLEQNFCGTGKMLAIDCSGNLYPCIRFYDFSLENRPGFKIGDIHNGLNKDRIRPFQVMNLKNISNDECINCEVGSGCAWCTACNYDFADTETLFQRLTFICKMHKANARANEYFWDKLAKATGLSSGKAKLRPGKYMQIITNDLMTPHCNYRNWQNFSNMMDETVFERSLGFCQSNGFIPVILGKNDSIKDMIINEEYFIISDSDGYNAVDNSIAVYDNNADGPSNNGDNCILLLGINNISKLSDFVEKLYGSYKRINLVLQDTELWTDEDLKSYRLELNQLSNIILKCYGENNDIEINIITDLWNLKYMSNCDAGEESFCIAPNGKIYICPAFYFDNPGNNIGSLEEGLQIKNSHLLNLDNAHFCKLCDVFSCKRCKFLNKKLTGEINIPSRMQCLISHAEREVSMKIQKTLREKCKINFPNSIKEISYSDPLELISSNITVRGECQ